MANKPNTERLLAQERKLKADIRTANIAAGAKYDITPEKQSFPWGEGSPEFKKQFGGEGTTAATTEHEYRGFKLIPMNKEPWHWTIEAIGFPTPHELQGNWTRVQDCESAIDQWHTQEEHRSGNKQ